jgi:hypothetical protein
LCENVTDSGSTYAQEGTDAHILCDHLLRKALGEKTKDPRKHLTYYDKAMEDAADEYVNFCVGEYERLKQAGDALMIVEQRVKYEEYVPQGSGSADCLIIGNGEMVVIDFKYGAGISVSAENNPQLKLYALGCLLAFDAIYDIETVKMCIVQPRRENISIETISKDALYQWAEEIVKPAAELAWEGEGEQRAGEHCQFCKIKATCRARAEANMALAKYDFHAPPHLEHSEIAEILAQADEFTRWLSDVKDHALNSALKGETFPGFKLVEGRSNREYTDEAVIAERLQRAGYYNIYKAPRLMGLTDMTKLLGKTTFGVLLEGTGDAPDFPPLVVKPKGRPTLVPDDDKRQPIQVNTAADDFADHEK